MFVNATWLIDQKLPLRSSIVSGSNLVVTNMIATGGLHAR